MPDTMLILRGIAGVFGGRSHPKGALDEPAALAYAAKRGYLGKVLPVSGEAYERSPQVELALHEIVSDPTVTALYGFSGGGYNLRHILDSLTDKELARIKLVVVLGAPNAPPSAFTARSPGNWEVVYRKDPSHMDGPAMLLGELISTEQAWT